MTIVTILVSIIRHWLTALKEYERTNQPLFWVILEGSSSGGSPQPSLPCCLSSGWTQWVIWPVSGEIPQTGIGPTRDMGRTSEECEPSVLGSFPFLFWYLLGAQKFPATINWDEMMKVAGCGCIYSTFIDVYIVWNLTSHLQQSFQMWMWRILLRSFFFAFFDIGPIDVLWTPDHCNLLRQLDHFGYFGRQNLFRGWWAGFTIGTGVWVFAVFFESEVLAISKVSNK